MKENEQVLVLTSTEPLPSKTEKFKTCYKILIGCMVVGIVVPPLLGWGFLGILVLALVHTIVVESYRNRLRLVKFKFVKTTYEDIFEKLQPILIGKYNSKIEIRREKNGIIMFKYDGVHYELVLNEDDTFSLRWSLSFIRAFFFTREHKLYKKILIAMGILGYELQKVYDIKA